MAQLSTLDHLAQPHIMNGRLNQNEALLAGLSFQQRNVIIALTAIIKSLPKDLISREAVRQNIGSCPLFDGVVGKSPEVAKEAEKLVGLILGPE